MVLQFGVPSQILNVSVVSESVVLTCTLGRKIVVTSQSGEEIKKNNNNNVSESTS